MNKDWLYEDVESVELRLEMDDPLKTGVSLTGSRANKFPEKYTWSLKIYEQGQESYPLEERDIGRTS